MFLELSKVPVVHRLKTELLLEHRVNVEQAGLIVSNVNNVSLVSSEDDSIDIAALFFNHVNLFGSFRVRNQ